MQLIYLISILIGVSFCQFEGEELEQLQQISSLLCNLEVKKFMMLNEKVLKNFKESDSGNKWSPLYKKLSGIAMKACLHDIKDPSNIDKIMSPVKEGDVMGQHLPFAAVINVEEFIKKNDFKITPSEEEHYKIYMESENEVRKMESEHGGKGMDGEQSPDEKEL